MPWPYKRHIKAIWRFLGADLTLTREVLHILRDDSPEKGQANASQTQDRSCPQPAWLLPATTRGLWELIGAPGQADTLDGHEDDLFASCFLTIACPRHSTSRESSRTCPVTPVRAVPRQPPADGEGAQGDVEAGCEGHAAADRGQQHPHSRQSAARPQERSDQVPRQGEQRPEAGLHALATSANLFPISHPCLGLRGRRAWGCCSSTYRTETPRWSRHAGGIAALCTLPRLPAPTPARAEPAGQGGGPHHPHLPERSLQDPAPGLPGEAEQEGCPESSSCPAADRIHDGQLKPEKSRRLGPPALLGCWREICPRPVLF
ncbi:uncharacterized protein LOC120403548 isoform X2 [Mauremys reevesii]|uniref:uncharacterized protein LOC120403548 isoform X2 n=1 Tax=Mauremys reevesii TaxID=260615 RepID=UPI00193F0B17|nr:uncharacterized protein LOC120403548 isoform X2 [Mauremys reevesii]XP_039390710.1 uncharacterized protein LOC120403548 isoform X2 [Mauremys reevesii]XP_039390728.1 uncharacterized protein LOC120403548 isoform X2 [Mauremys reevesii]XP_039390737.1 uncharacterized protein LOC120403548 isoform X2 [Mauremys reevesii]